MSIKSFFKDKFSLISDLWNFMKMRKKWWLLPTIILLIIFAIFIIITEASVLSSFLYALI